MKPLKKRSQMLLYACGGMGVNMLNLMMGSYLCSALLVGGFSSEAVPFQTYLGKDLVIAAVWSVFVLVAKILDGVVDIPMASFTDRLKSRFGRRRPALVMGLVPMVAAFLLFLLIPDRSGAGILNTLYYGLLLMVFYSFYTLTMVTYYATFTEIVDNEKDRFYISNVKSVCDIVYFILGYVAVRAFLNGMNIRIVALIVLPIVLTMLIPLFLIKEKSTLDQDRTAEDRKTVDLVKSLVYTFKNRDFILWMFVYSFMQFGVQLFLGGINEYFSKVGMNMIYTMMASFAPVPFTLIIYNKLTEKRGFGFSFRYTLITYSISMIGMFVIGLMPQGPAKLVCSVLGGLFASLSIGSLFSVAYSVPAYLAAEDEKRTGISHSAMYFAVQGLFAGVFSGLATGPVLTALKGTEQHPTDAMRFMTLVSAAACILALLLTFILPKAITNLGKNNGKT